MWLPFSVIEPDPVESEIIGQSCSEIIVKEVICSSPYNNTKSDQVDD
jgi:hypothetical protein